MGASLYKRGTDYCASVNFTYRIQFMALLYRRQGSLSIQQKVLKKEKIIISRTVIN